MRLTPDRWVVSSFYMKIVRDLNTPIRDYLIRTLGIEDTFIAKIDRYSDLSDCEVINK
ncbi:hypothetical protein [Aestuariivivens sediminicola]|uniref:hypothetical protein n=1 Tax=Aestuariivivens sediminicola TaxID=2913560 RepID=UPI001F5A3D8F|nr:hypothetical protein [Aestuariivivens sediminicola]